MAMDPPRIRESEDGVRGELTTIVSAQNVVIADDHLRLAALHHNAIHFPRHAQAEERGVGLRPEAFAHADIHDGCGCGSTGPL